jgi:hypothetical protein
MIEPKSTDIGRMVALRRTDGTFALGKLDGFDEKNIFALFGPDPWTGLREDLDWEEVAVARKVFRDAKLEFEMDAGPDEAPMRVRGYLFWPSTGLFARPDGTKGSGGAMSLVRAIRGGDVPAMGAGRATADSASDAGEA